MATIPSRAALPSHTGRAIAPKDTPPSLTPRSADVVFQPSSTPPTTPRTRDPQRAQDPPDRGVHIKRLTTGFASPAEDYLDAPLNLHDLVARHPTATYFLEMTGEAMAPTLRPHDILVIDRVLDPISGAIVVATVDGAFLVRRFQPGMHTVYLVADNPTAGAIRLNEGMNQQLWGVVTHLVRPLGHPTPPPPTAV